MTTPAPLYVPAPAVAPAPFGLFSVAQMPAESDPHWQFGGLQYEPIACHLARSWSDECVQESPGEAETKIVDEGVPLVTASPFVVYTAFECAAVGRSLEEQEARARDVLVLGEQFAVEAAFWSGTAGGTANAVTPFLADPTCTDLTPTPGVATDIVHGVGLLEDHLGANYGAAGVLHTPRLTAANAAHHKLASRDGSRLVSLLGNRWAFGGGYSGLAGPAGAAPAEAAWIIATGEVTVRRSEIFTQPAPIEQALNKSTNEVELQAERVYAVAFECVCAAVLVDVSCPCAAGS